MFFNAYKKSIKRKVFNSLSTIFEKAYSENMHRFIMKMKIVESILDSKSLRLNKKQVKEILDNFSFIESHLSNSFEELLIRKAKELLSIINNENHNSAEENAICDNEEQIGLINEDIANLKKTINSFEKKIASLYNDKNNIIDKKNECVKNNDEYGWRILNSRENKINNDINFCKKRLSSLENQMKAKLAQQQVLMTQNENISSIKIISEGKAIADKLQNQSNLVDMSKISVYSDSIKEATDLVYSKNEEINDMLNEALPSSSSYNEDEEHELFMNARINFENGRIEQSTYSDNADRNNNN